MQAAALEECLDDLTLKGLRRVCLELSLPRDGTRSDLTARVMDMGTNPVCAQQVADEVVAALEEHRRVRKRPRDPARHVRDLLPLFDLAAAAAPRPPSPAMITLPNLASPPKLFCTRFVAPI